MKMIDLHTHCNSGSPYDVPETDMHKRNFPFLMEEYKSAGISVGGFSYYSAVLHTEEIYEQNELLKAQAEQDERVYQWLVLDPRQERLFEQIRREIGGKKVLGIKLHSVGHKYDICEYGDKIFSFANELGCFVLMHPDKISDMVYFADKYPNMNLIIAHIHSPVYADVIRAAKHGNLFADTSGGDSRSNNVIEYTVERVGSEKIFFGTDTYSAGFQAGRIQFARMSDKDKENILYNNAKLHFSRQFEVI
jgi:predicted TIM-barrel fold metal-dependent hydrolase